jgi:hypothetical protein
VIPVKVRAKNGDSYVETYALLDSGSEVTLCQEELTKKLQFYGKKMNFTLTGMTGSQNVESQLVDIVVEYMDGTTVVELENVRTVKDIKNARCATRIHNKVSETFSDRKFLFKTRAFDCQSAVFDR